MKNHYKIQEKDSIYMIFPILLGRQMKFLKGLDFEIRTYRKKELSSEEFIKENPEAMLVTRIFGKDKNIGIANIKFNTISSKEWQEKKQETVKYFESKGINLKDYKSIEQ